MIASEIMQTDFDMLLLSNTIAEAIQHFKPAKGTARRRVFGLMVTDENDHLAGMLSMYDILLFIQPKHASIWGEMEDIDPSDLYDQRQPLGVVSKTDGVSAFYAGFPTDMPVENIMVGPPLFCFPDDELEVALDTMQQNRVHRLYVRGAESKNVTGVLA